MGNDQNDFTFDILRYNKIAGIYFQADSGSDIYGATIEDNLQKGVFIDTLSTQIKVLYCSLVGNEIGIHVYDSDHNYLIGNTIENSKYGIMLNNDTTVISDNIFNNTDFCITEDDDCDGTLISENLCNPPPEDKNNDQPPSPLNWEQMVILLTAGVAIIIVQSMAILLFRKKYKNLKQNTLLQKNKSTSATKVDNKSPKNKT